MEIRPGAPHCFGGLGLMVSLPSVELTGEAHSPTCELPTPTRLSNISLPEEPNYWRSRLLSILRDTSKRLPKLADSNTDIHWPTLPEPHIGFGSGTQFACAAVRLLMLLSELNSNASDPNLKGNGITLDQAGREEFRTILHDVGRCKRSHIGMNGFLDGGLIFDRGLGYEDLTDIQVTEDTQRTRSFGFPESWRILVLWEPHYSGDAGEKEQALFDECSLRENPFREEMIQLALSEVLPGAQTQDWHRFSQAIGRYGECAGEVFRSVQGDVYRSERIRFWVDTIRSLGIYGVGQSSWGPVVFAILPDDDQAQWLKAHLERHLQPQGWIRIASPAGPASITHLPS
jgi:predicted sugar kinase